MSSNAWPRSKEYDALTAECYGGGHTVEYQTALARKLDLYKEFMTKGSGYAKASRQAWEVTLGEAQAWCREHNKEAADPDDKFHGCRIDPDAFDSPRILKWVAKALGSTAVRKKDCPGPEYWSCLDWAKENPKEFWSALFRIVPAPTNPDGQVGEDEEEMSLEDVLGGNG